VETLRRTKQRFLLLVRQGSLIGRRSHLHRTDPSGSTGGCLPGPKAATASRLDWDVNSIILMNKFLTEDPPPKKGGSGPARYIAGGWPVATTGPSPRDGGAAFACGVGGRDLSIKAGTTRRGRRPAMSVCACEFVNICPNLSDFLCSMSCVEGGKSALPPCSSSSSSSSLRPPTDPSPLDLSSGSDSVYDPRPSPCPTVSTSPPAPLKFAVVNEGKIGEARSIDLTAWLGEHCVDVCFVAEAANRGKKDRVTSGDYAWAAPLDQRKGGSGFLFRHGLSEWTSRVSILQDETLDWSVASVTLSSGVLLVSAYITPVAVQGVDKLRDLLRALTQCLGEAEKVVVAGDWNSASGSVQRGIIEEWAELQSLLLVNPGLKTHWQFPHSPGTDLDLVFAKGCRLVAGAHERPAAGHLRQIYSLGVSTNATNFPEGKVAWRRLSDPRARSRYRRSVERLLAQGCEAAGAVSGAAEAVGLVHQLRRNQLPGRVRAKIRRLRRQARRHPVRSPEHGQLVIEIASILRHFRVKAWRKHVRRLTGERGLSSQLWKTVSGLTREAQQSRAVGIPDREIAEAYKKVYSDNRVRRPDWVNGTRDNRKAEISGHGIPAALSIGDRPFTPEEVQAALKSLPTKRAPGVDQIPGEAYTALADSEPFVECLAMEANDLLEGRRRFGPTTGRLVTIPKSSRPTTDPLQLRPLMMLPTHRKFIERLVAKRIGLVSESRGWDGMHCTQGGFRQGYSLTRQLVLADVAVQDARRHGKSVRLVALDCVKAFDRIPKEFAVHCAVSLLGPDCRRLAGLVAEIVLSPLRARVGDCEFEVETGVPQGGVLSPWLYVSSMNDLARRLDDSGYRLGGGDVLGLLLYADDILLVDSSLSSSDSRIRVVEDWMREWGGKLNSLKTQCISINFGEDASPPRVGGSHVGAAERAKVKYLGAHITRDGVVPCNPPDEFLRHTARLYSLSANGLPPAVVLSVLYAKAWPRVALGLEVCLPDLSTYCRAWQRAARRVLQTYHTSHGAEVQRDLGLLNHPVWWLARSFVSFFSKSLSGRDVYFRRIFAGLPSGHPLKDRVVAFASFLGISLGDFESSPKEDLLRRAKARVREWTRQHLEAEAGRLGILDRSDCVWSEWRDDAAPYLYEAQSGVCFKFRAAHLGPSNVLPVDCFFCGAASADTGRHVALECSTARALHPLPGELAGLSPQAQADALRLSDKATQGQRRSAGEYLSLLWRLRCERRLSRPAVPGAPSGLKSNSRFMAVEGLSRKIESHWDTRAVRPLAPAEAPPAEPTPSPPTVPPAERVRGKWTVEEDLRLVRALERHGRGDNVLLGNEVGGRRAQQVINRLATKAFKDLLGSRGRENTSAFGTKLRWSQEEFSRLIEAMNGLNTSSDFARLAAAVGTRTAHQVQCQVTRLLKVGRLQWQSAAMDSLGRWSLFPAGTRDQST